MRLISVFLLVFVCFAYAQTPFEFAIVQDLIGGEPFVSVIRIKINHGVPEPGRIQLQLTTRAGMIVEGQHCVFPDSQVDGAVKFKGLLEYNASIPLYTLERVFSVISDCMNRFPNTRITDLSLDVVGAGDLSWIGIECEISSMKAVLDGTLSHLEFWQTARLREFEVGTVLIPTEFRQPGIPLCYTSPDTLAMEPDDDTAVSTQPWKSLILPGWGQLSCGRGIGWLNLAVEAGGIALIAAGEDETGLAVLSVNHFVSFIDLF